MLWLRMVRVPVHELSILYASTDFSFVINLTFEPLDCAELPGNLCDGCRKRVKHESLWFLLQICRLNIFPGLVPCVYLQLKTDRLHKWSENIFLYLLM